MANFFICVEFGAQCKRDKQSEAYRKLNFFQSKTFQWQFTLSIRLKKPGWGNLLENGGVGLRNTEMCNQHSRFPGVGDLFVANCVNKLAKSVQTHI